MVSRWFQSPSFDTYTEVYMHAYNNFRMSNELPIQVVVRLGSSRAVLSSSVDVRGNFKSAMQLNGTVVQDLLSCSEPSRNLSHILCEYSQHYVE